MAPADPHSSSTWLSDADLRVRGILWLIGERRRCARRLFAEATSCLNEARQLSEWRKRFDAWARLLKAAEARAAARAQLRECRQYRAYIREIRAERPYEYVGETDDDLSRYSAHAEGWR